MVVGSHTRSSELSTHQRFEPDLPGRRAGGTGLALAGSMGQSPRRPADPFTVAIASRDRVYLDSLSASLARSGLGVLVLAPLDEAPRIALDGVDVLVLDTESLGAEDLDEAAALQQSYPLVEVVAIAGDSPVADAVRALRAGVFTVLQHPVSDGLLVEALVAAGRRHRHARQRLEELNGSGSRKPVQPPEGGRTKRGRGGKAG